jgi:hypothetical protein
VARGTAIPRRGGFLRRDAAFGVEVAQGESSEWRLIPHSQLVRLWSSHRRPRLTKPCH